MSECLRSKVVKTNREHTCFGCGRKFSKGTEMEFNVCIDGGSAFNTYLCPTCTEIVHNLGYDDEFCFGDLREQAEANEQAKANGFAECCTLCSQYYINEKSDGVPVCNVSIDGKPYADCKKYKNEVSK